MLQDVATDVAYFARRAEEERRKASASDHPNVKLVHLQMAEECIRRAVSLSQTSPEGMDVHFLYLAAESRRTGGLP